METILLTVSSLEVLFCLNSRKFKKSLLTIFCSLWCLIFWLYSFRFYGLYDCESKTYIVYIVGIFSFFVGYCFIETFVMCKSDKKKQNVDKRFTIKLFFIYILSWISILVFIRKAILAIPYWLAGGPGAVKVAVIMDDALNDGNISDIIFTFVARPFQIIIVIYAIIAFFVGEKNNAILWNAFFLTLFEYLCTGSKFAISTIGIIVFSYLFLYSELNIKQIINRYKTLVIIVSATFLFIIILMSLQEDGVGVSFYSYLCGCMPCSDQALDELSNTMPYYGLVSFNGILRVLNIVPHYIGISPSEIKLALDFASNYMLKFESTTIIGDGIKYNAFISLFSYFFADGRYWGVCIISVVFGGLCSWGFKKSKIAPSYYSYSLVLIFALFIATSMVRFQFSMTYYAMAVVYIVLLFPKKTFTVQKNKNVNPKEKHII